MTRKLEFIVNEMVAMGKKGYMSTSSYLLVNYYAREIIAEERITPGQLADRLKKGLIEAGIKEKFNKETVGLLMEDVEYLRQIDYRHLYDNT